MLLPLFERFTQEARAVLTAAQEEARQLHHGHVGDGHILLGVLHQQDAPASGVLSALGVDGDRFRSRLSEIVAAEDGLPSGGQLPFTPRTKEVLELALRETLSSGADWISPEMLLLGIARASGGAAMQILVEFDVSAEQIRNAVMEALPDNRPIPGELIDPSPGAPEDLAWMFGRFTERAREVVTCAQTEARELRFGHVGSEALLLGLLREHEGLAARVLRSFDVTVEVARAEVVKRVSAGERLPESVEIPFTPRAEELLERALREALSLGHNYVGTEHILLAMASVGEGEGMNALRARGVDSIMIRDEVIKQLRGPRKAGVRKAYGTARAGPSLPQSDGFWVNQDPDVARVMKRAAARALDDGRTEIAAGDLLIALSRDPSIGPRLAEVGIDETTIRKALGRPLDSEPPSDAPGPS